MATSWSSRRPSRGSPARCPPRFPRWPSGRTAPRRVPRSRPSGRVAEYRPGPLKRSNLGSAESRHSDIGDHGEVQQLRIANYGDDPYPDLAILNNSGDGRLDRDERLSYAGSGPGDFDYALKEKYGEFGSTAEPPAMPSDGWKQFYESCA
ncbi:hypothetical protein Z951_19445 [Streptomyces sp. PRh5]|nr:hypothetical protein Z951_19445 [Streptomyces sp. PRh5]